MKNVETLDPEKMFPLLFALLPEATLAEVATGDAPCGRRHQYEVCMLLHRLIGVDSKKDGSRLTV